MKDNYDILTIGLGFGDEGKGSFIQYIASKCEDIRYFEKYNGGCQGQHCVNYNGKRVYFSQLSSSILYGKSTIIGKDFIFEPFSFMNEVDAVSASSGILKSDILSRTFIDNQCICVTPIHRMVNVWEEEYSTQFKRGSVGIGVSIAGYYNKCGIVLHAEDLAYTEKVREIIENQISYFSDLYKNEESYSFLEEMFDEYKLEIYLGNLSNLFYDINFNIVDTSVFHSSQNSFVYENSQGILLDVNYGLKPNTTLLDVSADKKMDCHKKIGIIRSLYTRHGPGVFPTENLLLNKIFCDDSQEEGKYSGKIRFGYFDCILFFYAVYVTSVNEIYLSHLDYLSKLNEINICKAYKYHGDITQEFKELFEWKYDNDNNIIIYRMIKAGKYISNYLRFCTPVYEKIVFGKEDGFKKKTEKYIKVIESLCNVKITVASFGSNIYDKVERLKLEVSK